MKHTIITMAVVAVLSPLTAFLCPLQAQEISIDRVKHAGPFLVQQPLLLDSMTLDGKKYSQDDVINTPLSFEGLKSETMVAMPVSEGSQGALNLCSFSFSVNTYTKVTVKAEGPRHKKVFIGGTEGEQQTLTPGQYDVVVKYVADTTALKLSIKADKDGSLSLVNEDTKRPFNLDDNMEMKHYGALALSPSGKYLYSNASHFNNEGHTIWEARITELATGRIVATSNASFRWMPRSDRYYQVKNENGHRLLVVTDPATGKEDVWARDLPSDNFIISPTEDYLIYYIYNEGPRKQDGVYEVVHPDDRQPGYRGRSAFGRYDIKSGLAQQLTYGYHSMWVNDISEDGRYLLFSMTQDSITQRPSSLQSVYRLDLQTMEKELIIDRDGFVASTSFVPGSADRLVVMGTPEAFGGIGRNLPDDMTPSMYDYQLFLVDIPAKQVTPVTRDFNPSIESVVPSVYDGMVYFTAANADSVSIYRLNPKDLSIQMIPQPMEVVGSVSIADKAPLMAFYGTSTCVADRLYTLSLGKKPQLTLFEDLNAERMAEIELGECHEYRMTTSHGYDVTGFYVLPAKFDATKRYPVIVDYYGGCSPTSHRFGGGSHYPFHYWNALGYVVLVVNPSGAAGFGQEWAARHVNTAGEGVAEDIIEATEWFADNHAWVNKEKIGCVSASYGGFMTQTLLSKTDLFACGISHAGISSHTSYWGEGYWGYSYSQVSMANSYPWNRRDLYVDRSPLYNADKIHKPILFTHGTADTNVPIGESIQMYTAMKILGVPTAFVMVEGENHGIMDYAKRKKWIHTMVAWFQRWLQDDPSWWEGMYPLIEN